MNLQKEFQEKESKSVRLTLTPQELDYNKGGGLCISVPGYQGNPEDAEPNQVWIEVYEGKLRVHVWNGGQDPTTTECLPETQP